MTVGGEVSGIAGDGDTPASPRGTANGSLRSSGEPVGVPFTGGEGGSLAGEFAAHAPRPASGSGVPAGTRPARGGGRACEGTTAPLVRHLGRADYEPVWRAMQVFTAARSDSTPDELWLVEHPPVYTLGQAGKPEHLIAPTTIPLIHIDRGGQITYHGPGQIVIYLLVDLKRRGVGIRELVTRIEAAIIDLLAAHGVTAERRAGAPGVYVADAKIAALGLRVKQGRTYHGLALNVDMDLTPFSAINPCGYVGLAVTDCRRQGIAIDQDQVGRELVECLCEHLNCLVPGPLT